MGSALRGQPLAGGQLQAAALLAVVADPNRLALLGVLTAGTTCVCELQEQVPLAANLLSYHLRVLREAGLVTAARRGRWVDYTLADGALARLHAALPGATCRYASDCSDASESSDASDSCNVVGGAR
jgi:ArsR family transcriptional regulator